MPGSLRHIPAIQWISPQLASRAEVIRGHARKGCRTRMIVQTKQFLMGPNICAVMRNINRDVSHHPHSTAFAVIFKLLPLAEELVLSEFVYVDLRGQVFSPSVKNPLVSLSEFAPPLRPNRVLVEAFAGHKQRVILQPARIDAAKLFERRTLRRRGVRKKALSAFLEQTQLDLDNASKLHMIVRQANPGLQILRRQESLLSQGLQIDEQWISRERGKKLIWRVSVARRSQWQHLPDLLSGRRQELHEFMR